MIKKMSGIAIVALSVLFAAQTHADDHGVKSEKQANNVVEFRKALLQLVRSNMGPLGAMAKGNIPYDPEVMSVNALRIEQLGLMLEDYFIPDTTKFDVDTGAKAKIWDNFDDFAAKANDMVSAAQALQEVVAEGDEGNYRSAIGKIGGTCKGCHDEYKED